MLSIFLFWQDTFDPFVVLQVGKMIFSSIVKKNAGGTQFTCFTGTRVQILTRLSAAGTNVTFDEKISFERLVSESTLNVKVFDKNSVMGDVLVGECDIDLRDQTIKVAEDIAEAAYSEHYTGSQFTCCASTNVQIRTPQELRANIILSLLALLAHTYKY